MKYILTQGLVLALTLFPKVASAHIGSHFYELDPANKVAATIDKITGWTLNITMGLGALLVLAAVFFYATAKGEESKAEKANTYLTYAILVLIVGVLVGAINIALQHFIF